ncbi:MAG TPA: hypothetical protein DCE80_19625 [Ignavibacteriales bacterium]|nr:hypothetical protein [Ignavibacteriales bacterium]
MKIYKSNIVWIFTLVVALVFNTETYSEITFEVNKAHLDYLYEEIQIDGKEMAIIHIYSNYPDYAYVGDDDEGIACIDDAARAAIFYLEYYKAYNDSTSLSQFNKLVEFVLHMQAENGFFYNFIWEDGSINKTYKTSVAEPNWWTWRALWALMEYSKQFENLLDSRTLRVKQCIEKTIAAIKLYIPKEKEIISIDGIEFPKWLPLQFASDQAALLVIILTDYYKTSRDNDILDYLNSLVQGIMMMQLNDKECEFNGAFLSWQNTWHGWGNSQAYALLKAYRVLNEESIKTSALLELNNFYERLIENGFLSYFKVQKHHNQIEIVESSKYSQIAYNIRPMVFALLEVYNITLDSSYAIKAGQVAQWFVGRNPACAIMYNPHSGIFYDGIENEKLINKNSGAESTIEGLLSLLKISLNPFALKEFENTDQSLFEKR